MTFIRSNGHMIDDMVSFYCPYADCVPAVQMETKNGYVELMFNHGLLTCAWGTLLAQLFSPQVSQLITV